MTSFVDDNGNYLDYSGDDFAITKQVATWYDFKLKGDISVDLNLPNTSKNRDILGYYGAQQIDSPAFSQNAFTVVRNGNKILKGYLVIKGHDKNSIQVFFISGNSNWFNLLQFNCKEIDFPDRFTVNSNDVNASKSNTEGLIFPIVDWWASGQHRSTVFIATPNDRQEGLPHFHEFHPCLYLHTLVTQLCAHGGVKVDGDLLNDEIYKRLIITNDGPDLFWPDWIVNQSKIRAFANNGVNYSTASDPQPVQWEPPTELGSALFNSDYSFICPRTATYSIECEFFFAPAADYTAKLYVKAVGASSFTYDSDIFQVASYKFIEIQRVFNKGDQFAIYIQRNTGGPTYRVANTSGRSNIRVQILKNIGTQTTPDWIGTFSTLTHKIPAVALAPDLKATEIIKFLCIYFGAVCSYDEYSKTLTINKLSRMQKENGEDWSEYFVSQKTIYQTGVANHNYIKFSDGEEDLIKSYNEQSPKTYGGGDIQTPNLTTYEKDIYTIPFSPSYDDINSTELGWFLPYVKYYELQFEEEQAYSGTTSNITTYGATITKFTATFNNPIIESKVYFVKSNSGEYTGFHTGEGETSTTNPILNVIYGSNDTGTIRMYSVSKVTGKPRIMLCYPGYTLANAGGSNYWILDPSNSGSNQTTGAVAFFDKPLIESTLDEIKDSLAIDTLNGRTYNITIGERYHRELENIYGNPRIEAYFLLPTKVFQAFNFQNFVYLKTKDLTGYFWVQKIDQYKDADTPVKVELLYVD